MSYLSMRMREIRAEEARRKEPLVYAINMRLTPYDQRGQLRHDRAVQMTEAVDYRGRAG